MPKNQTVKRIHSTLLSQVIETKPRLSPFNLDFSVETKEPLVVSTELQGSKVDVKVNGNLRLLGPSQKPLAQGEISVEPGGTFEMNSHRFDIKIAQFSYNNSPLNNPSILISSSTLIDNIDIHLNIQGDLNDPTFKLTSQPPIPEAEISSLLAFGMNAARTDSQLESYTEDNLVTQSTLQAASVLINEKLGVSRKVYSEFGVRLDLLPSYDEETGEIVPTISATREWTPKLKTSISRTLNSTNQTNRLQTEYRVNRNLLLIGSFERKDTETDGTKTQEQEPDIFGLDLEYKLEFNLDEK